MNKSFNYKMFGLEKRDILVYEAMLGSSKASSIRTIAQLAGQNRGTTFEIIKKLSNLGIIGNHMKNSRKYYFPKSPTALASYAKEVQSNIQTEMVNLESYVTSLRSTETRELSHQFTQFYDGEDEIAALLREVLETVGNSRTKHYRVISSAEVRNHLYKKFKNFTKQRIKAKISVDVIAVGKLGSKAELSKAKLLTAKDAPSSYTIIFGDKVAHISLSDYLEISGVLINDKGVARLHEIMFDSLWGQLA